MAATSFKIMFLSASVSRKLRTWVSGLSLGNMRELKVYLFAIHSPSSLNKVVILFLLQPDLPFKLNLILLQWIFIRHFKSFLQQGTA